MKLRLAETLDSNIEYQEYQDGEIKYFYSKIKNKELLFYVIPYTRVLTNTFIQQYTQLPMTATTGGHEVGFGLATRPIEDPSSVDMRDAMYSGLITDEDTGTGDGILIFSTAVKIFVDYVKKNQPAILMIGAQPNRTKIYEMLIKKVSKQFPQYSYKQSGLLFFIYRNNAVR